MAEQQKYINKLKGARVLVIGGSAGLGYGVAEACLELGSTVTISSSSSARVSAAISKLQAAYPSAASRISGHECNLGDEATLESNVAALFDKVGEVDHIVFTAGDALATIPIKDATLAQIKQAGMVRFFAPLLVARFGATHMPASSNSSITLTTGTVGEKPIPEWSVVGSYAAGHHGMARGLALDLKPIRVNAVSPGPVDTELWNMDEREKKDFFKMLTDKCTTGEMGKVEDVAEAYLACMKDRNCTGSVISSTGGFLLT